MDQPQKCRLAHAAWPRYLNQLSGCDRQVDVPKDSGAAERFRETSELDGRLQLCSAIAPGSTGACPFLLGVITFIDVGARGVTVGGGSMLGRNSVGGFMLGRNSIGGKTFGGDAIAAVTVAGYAIGGKAVSNRAIAGIAVGDVPVGGVPVGGVPVGDVPVSAVAVSAVPVRSWGAIPRGTGVRGASIRGVIRQDAQAHGSIWSVTHPSMSRLAQARLRKPLRKAWSCPDFVGRLDTRGVAYLP
jgi:hypothetical protein